MAKKQIQVNRKYRFCGNGPGVAGLPFEIDEQDAMERGVVSLLEAAIRAGNYKLIKPDVAIEPVSDAGNEQGE